MLSLTEIEKYYPEKERPFKRNILREYLQYKILEIVFNSKIGSQLAFLGGTAIRIVHGSGRFSEDLDFDNFGLPEKEFAGLTEEVKKGLERQGYEVEIRNVFKGAYRSYIKMPKVLFENNISGLQEEKIMIQIDTVPHAFDYERDLKVLNKFDVFTQIYTTPIDVLLSQKIFAALSRKRAKGRDFFDIVYLLPLSDPNFDYLKAKCDISNKRELREAFLSEAEKLNFEALAKDVQPFLINSGDSKRIQLFPDYIKTALR